MATEPVGDLYTAGKGRGVQMSAKPNIEYGLGWEVDYDYWCERLGRAIIWAAGKEPKVGVNVSVPATIHLQERREALPRLTWSLTGREDCAGLAERPLR